MAVAAVFGLAHEPHQKVLPRPRAGRKRPRKAASSRFQDLVRTLGRPRVEWGHAAALAIVPSRLRAAERLQRKSRCRDVEPPHGAGSVRSYRPLFPAHQRIFKTRIKQMPEVAEVPREAALAQMRMIDSLIAGRHFISGERYTIADITAMVALGLGAVVGPTVDSGLANLTRW